MNPIKEYFNYFTKKYDIDWKFEIFRWTFTITLVGLFLGGIYMLDSCSNKQMEEERAATLYEIEIIDKYDCIGSTYHLVGGRAPEQEYHIIYKVTPLTKMAKKKYYGNGEEDDEVQYRVYRKLNIGHKFRGHSNDLWSYYR